MLRNGKLLDEIKSSYTVLVYFYWSLRGLTYSGYDNMCNCIIMVKTDHEGMHWLNKTPFFH